MPWLNPHRWTDDELASLRAWRAEGHTNREIGRRLGRSDKAVGTKAKDLGIESLPKGRQRVHDPVPERAGRVTLPPLPSLQDQ